MNLSEAYRILSLRDGATEEQVKESYKSLAQKYSADKYESGPLSEDAKRQMDEVNLAFDTVMTHLRMDKGSSSSSSYNSANNSSSNTQYADIRQKINHGQTDEALRELNNLQDAHNAEWNFLMGSAYYYKGWLNDASRYFQTACKLDPGNREYSNAMNNLRGNQNGNMHGNPYASRGQTNNNYVGCSCCDVCTALICMDVCCNCGGC